MTTIPGEPNGVPRILDIPSPPFDNIVYADVIIRSSDGAEYRMSKTLLAQSSPFFAQMLSLPQPVNVHAEDEQKNGLPVIPVTEPAKVLDLLLQFCIPRAPPKLEDFTAVANVLEGAKKYQIEWAFDTACGALQRLAKAEPVRAYAVACQYGLEREARRAAWFALRLTVSSLISSEVFELKSISGDGFRRLLQYRERCRDAIVQHISSWDCLDGYYAITGLPPQIWDVHRGHHCRCSQTAIDALAARPHSQEQRYVRGWWEAYMQRTVEELRGCTWEGSVSVERILAAFIAVTGTCSDCNLVASDQLSHFAKYLAAQVAAKISQVLFYFNIPAETITHLPLA